MFGSWNQILSEDMVQKGKTLAERAQAEREAGKVIYPAQDHIFEALKLTTPDRLKVCIVGQDPYHGANQANGLAFSVNPGVKLPPSLRNIFNELTVDIGCPYPQHGDLSAWADQGVLLLNTSLTVEESRPNSHVDWGWHDFTKAVFQAALGVPQPVVFILWGKNAQDFLSDMDIAKYPNKKVLTSTHPSPFSARRGTRTVPAFVGSRPFSKANSLLKGMGSNPVNWNF